MTARRHRVSVLPVASPGPQSALIIEVPEAEPAVARHRERLDPSAALGIPAHITLLYPFLPPAAVSSPVLAELEPLFGAVAGSASGWSAPAGSARTYCGSPRATLAPSAP